MDHLVDNHSIHIDKWFILKHMTENSEHDCTPALLAPSAEAPSVTAIIRKESPRKSAHSTAVIADYKGVKLALDAVSLDGRSSVARQVSAVYRQLVASVAAREAVLLDALDQFLVVKNSVIDRRRRRLTPGMMDHLRLADSLVRHIQTLGLEKRV